MIFMVSSRDRNCQRIEMTREVIARAPPPAFLFPNQQCQRPRAEAPRTTFRQNHPLAPDVGGGGYLSNLEFRVKSFFSKPSNQTHQKHPKAKPVDRGHFLKKATNQVKKENPKINSLDLRSNQLSSFELFQLLPGGRFLLKPPTRVNRPFSLSSMSWPRPFERQKRGDEALEDRVFANSSPSRLRPRNLPIHLSKCKPRRP